MLEDFSQIIVTDDDKNDDDAERRKSESHDPFLAHTVGPSPLTPSVRQSRSQRSQLFYRLDRPPTSKQQLPVSAAGANVAYPRASLLLIDITAPHCTLLRGKALGDTATNVLMTKQGMTIKSSTIKKLLHNFTSYSPAALEPCLVSKGNVGNAKLIEKATYSGIILPSGEWHTLNHHGLIAKITYRIRVLCDKHYYNSTCMKFCRPRDDKFGHFTCDPQGNKECIAGWTGTNCEIAVCKTGCHAEHGKCDYPGGCECRPGWKGEFCDQCQPYPDCKHGYCHSPYECICNTNWGGILCDKDLNYCGNHPCLNGGTCSNTAPDQYLCACPEGFSGTNCEIVVNPCVTAPCANGGTCLEAGGHFQCICAAGWTGSTCTLNVDECASSPCLNGGTCVDKIDNYRCLCSSTWQGDRCQFDTNECETTKPCANAISCENSEGDYRCECQKGWSGKNCDHNINDCLGQCLHDATCIDLVDDYYCACAPGFDGKDCQIDVNECETNPCKNGGECVDLINRFRCICPVGFAGDLCEVDHDHCKPNPCRNDAQCLNMADDYYCHCTENWQDKNCSTPKIMCTEPPCDIVDNCLMVMPADSINMNSLNDTVLRLSSTSSLNSNALGLSAAICNNHGRCTMRSDGDFKCLCDAGYTGRYCQESINECELQPCMNGATCVDKVNSFLCICPEGWEGETCSKRQNECEPNPCENNGTCASSTDDFTCKCRDGWKGRTCNLRNSHCDRSTCRNGGTCIDLGDRFFCQCTEMWEGITCQLAVSEDRSFSKANDVCYWHGQYFAYNSNWQHKCNTCGCADGLVKCTSVWCGFSNCISNGCERPNQICVPTNRERCLSPPCQEWGECRDLLNGNRVSGAPSMLPAVTSCRPNQAVLSDFCIRLSLYVDVTKLRPSVNTEDFCNEIRRLISIHEAAKNSRFEIVAQCDIKQLYNDTVEITVACTDTEPVDCANALEDDVKFIGEVIGRKQVTSFSILNAVIEVKLETALVAENKQVYNTKYLIGLCLLTAISSAVLLLTVIYCYRHSRSNKLGWWWWWCKDDASAPFEEEKSNNIAQNAENFRRFANALKENVVCPHIEPHASTTEASCGVSRVNVVHPISRVSSAEMMELINDSGSECGKAPSKLSPKALLSKTQNTTFQKNSTAASSTSTLHTSAGECSPSTSSCVASTAKEQSRSNIKPLNVSVVPTIVQRNINAAARTQHNCSNVNVIPTVLV
ncbi:hypothetical protein V9T40_005410 [Parthenolecanium corni]|uniref:Delta-like protein n=1 Tax=Parthenolecanium corni TaxID=536013 RepID=A0AAN9TGT6_9HEMI